jgi:hypothetical protein
MILKTYFQERTVTPFRPYSMSYAGHQFDGQVNWRAGELLSRNKDKEQFLQLRV